MAELTVKLKTNGQILNGFDFAEVSLNLYAVANTAVLVFTGRKPEDMQKVKSIIKKYNDAEVYLCESNRITGLKITGYISGVEPCFEKELPSLKIKVISKAGKYVNSAVKTGKTFINQRVSEIVNFLCPNIGVNVITDKVLAKFVVLGSETTDEALARLHRKSGLLIYSAPDGRLEVAERAPFTRRAGWLITGENIISSERPEDNDEAIVLSGQKAFDDDVDIDDAICTKLESPGRKVRYVYGDDVSLDALEAAKEQKTTVYSAIPSWFDNEGKLLALNTWYGTKDLWQDVGGAMLLFSLVFRLDKSGYQAFLGVEK